MTDEHPYEGHTVEVYRDQSGEFRWHRKAANGRIVSDSGEGYINKAHTLAAASEYNPGIEVVDLTIQE